MKGVELSSKDILFCYAKNVKQVFWNSSWKDFICSTM